MNISRIATGEAYFLSVHQADLASLRNLSFHILPNPSWDLSGSLLELLLLAFHGLCPFLLLLAWLTMERSSRTVEVRGGLTPDTAHHPPPTCWDCWCPALRVLFLSCSLTKSSVGQVKSTVLGHRCWCFVLSQSHRHIYETVLFRFYYRLFITVLLCPILAHIQIGLAKWH